MIIFTLVNMQTFTKVKSTQSINIQLPPIDTPQGERRSTLFPPRTATGLFGKRGSGKTVILYNIIKDYIRHYPLITEEDKKYQEMFKVPFPKPNHQISSFFSSDRQKEKNKKRKYRQLHIIIFASTINSDPQWVSIVNYLRKQGIRLTLMVSLFSPDGKENKIKTLRENLLDLDNNDEEKYDYIVIIDDLPKEIRDNTEVPFLLKTSRHLSIENFIISTQSPVDLKPESINQLDNVLLFGNLGLDKLKHLYEITDLPIDYDLFVEIWRDATKEKHGFLVVDVRNNRFHSKFTHEYLIKKK